MDVIVIRLFFIFLIIGFGIIAYNIWKYPNAIKFLLGKAINIVALIVGAGLILYWLFFNHGPTGNPYEEIDRCETTVAKIC